MALAAKVKTESFEGRFFDRFAVPKLTVREVWEMYEPICKRDNDAWQTELGRARYVLSPLNLPPPISCRGKRPNRRRKR